MVGSGAHLNLTTATVAVTRHKGITVKYGAIALTLIGTFVLAPAATATASQPATFKGSCSLSGVVVFDPGIGQNMVTTTATARASGQCSGVLTRPDGTTHQLADEEATYRGRASGQQSCAAGTTIGRSWLRIAGTNVRFTFSETRVGALALIRLRDAAGGNTTGVASVMASEDSPEHVRACTTPDGLTQVPVAISTASTPL